MQMIKIFPNIEELNNFAAEKFVGIGNDAIKKRGRFTVALSGGSTPKTLYEKLLSDNFREKICWKSVFFFFGDERNVPAESEESNFRMANENLLKPLDIDTDKIYRWKTEMEIPEKIAEDYALGIEYFFHGVPEFDLILLGLGDDAHTASLFPNTKALNETEKIAAANFVEKFDSYRLTLTFPVINKAANVMFIVSGENKAEALREVLHGKFQPDNFPAQNVKPENGNLWWLVDKAAAKLLDS